jgi:Pentapeptide repeats (8 copies)
MDENHQDWANHKLVTTEDKLWLPPSYTNSKTPPVSSVPKKRGINWGFTDKSFWDRFLFLWALLSAFGAIAIPFVIWNYTQQQAQLSIAASERQHQTDLQIAQDQERETTLKTYLDDMSGLLLNYNLRKSKSRDEVRQLARERTLTTLRRLDADRNMIVLQFLQDAHLIGEHNAVIDLSGTNLSGVDLSGTNLGGALQLHFLGDRVL